MSDNEDPGQAGLAPKTKQLAKPQTRRSAQEQNPGASP
jgi:hypothetical protein